MHKMQEIVEGKECVGVCFELRFECLRGCIGNDVQRDRLHN